MIYPGTVEVASKGQAYGGCPHCKYQWADHMLWENHMERVHRIYQQQVLPICLHLIQAPVRPNRNEHRYVRPVRTSNPPPPLQEPVKITFSEQDFILLRCKNHLEFKYPNRNVWNVLNNLFLPLRPRLFLYDIQPMDLHASWSCSHFTSTNQVDLNFLISLQIFQSSWTRPNVHFMVPLFHYPSLCLASGPPTCNNLSSNLSLKS